MIIGVPIWTEIWQDLLQDGSPNDGEAVWAIFSRIASWTKFMRFYLFIFFANACSVSFWVARTATACTTFELLLSLTPTGLKKCSIVYDMSVRKHCTYQRHESMGNVGIINVRECDVIREIHENFVSRTFPRILVIWTSWEGWRVRKWTDSRTRTQKRRMKTKQHQLLLKYCKRICHLHSAVVVCLMHAKYRKLANWQRSLSVTCVYIRMTQLWGVIAAVGTAKEKQMTHWQQVVV